MLKLRYNAKATGLRCNILEVKYSNLLDLKL